MHCRQVKLWRRCHTSGATHADGGVDQPMFALQSNQNQQPRRVWPASRRIHGSGDCWLVWSVPVVNVCVCVCQPMTGKWHNTRFLWTRCCRCWWGGMQRQKLVSKCNQSGAKLFWLAAADHVFPVIIGIANGDVLQLLRKNEKCFEEGIRGFFFSLPPLQSDCGPETFPETSLWCFFFPLSLSADFSWHQKWKLEKALLPLKALCWS